MALFRYKALSAAGEALAGTMEAARAEDVVARLQEQGHLPLDVGTSLEEGAGAGLAALFRKKALDDAAVLQFTQQLATLLGAGQALGEIPDKLLGAIIHAPFDATVAEITEHQIVLTR